MNDNTRRLLEAAGVATFGGVLAGAVGSTFGWAIPLAAVGAVNGAISGFRRIYDWRSVRGGLAFALDSTWSLFNTGTGLVANVVGMVQRDGGYVTELSERHNRHVYRRGFSFTGYATTLGNVIGGAADVERPRRARLITDHEDVHVWQARWFGPLFPVLYVGWMVVGGAAGIVYWAVARRKRGDSLFKTVESAAYHINPFEWWCYSRDGYWPPNGKLVDFGWREPCCKPMTVAKPDRPSGLAQFRTVTPR